MAGPNGEQCETCYYYDPIDTVEGYCRFENADAWIERPGTNAVSNWPKVRGAVDWSGDWLEATSVTAGFRAVGSFVTPTGTAFNVTDPVNWIKYDPGNLIDGLIMDNVTLTAGVLSWSIPGSPPPGSTWENFISVFGSVLFPTANTFLEVTAGTAGIPFSLNVVQRLQVNPTTDNISLPWSLQGIAPVGQTGSMELLMRGDIGLGVYTSNAMQIDVHRRS